MSLVHTKMSFGDGTGNKMLVSFLQETQGIAVPWFAHQNEFWFSSFCFLPGRLPFRSETGPIFSDLFITGSDVNKLLSKLSV